jgi:hypothetical protein
MGEIGARKNQLLQLLHLGLRQRRRTAATRCIAQPGNPIGVVAVHPVAQRLPVHAAGRRRFGPRGPFQNIGDRQNTAGYPALAASRRSLPKLRRRQLQPRHLDPPTHDPLLRSKTPATENRT